MSNKALTTFSKVILLLGMFMSFSAYAQSNTLFSQASRSGLEALRAVASEGWQLAADDPSLSDFSDVADQSSVALGGNCNFPCYDGDYQCFNRRRDCNLNHQMAVAMGEDCPDKNFDGGFQTAEATDEDLRNLQRTEVAIIGSDDRMPCTSSSCLSRSSSVGRVICRGSMQRRNSIGAVRTGVVEFRSNFTVVGRSTLSGIAHFNWDKSSVEPMDISQCRFETELGNGKKHVSAIELVGQGVDLASDPQLAYGPNDWSVLRLVTPVPEEVNPIQPLEVSDEELQSLNLYMISYSKDKSGKQKQTTVERRPYVSGSDQREIIHYFDTNIESSGAPLLTMVNGKFRSVCTHVAAEGPRGPNICIRNSSEMLAAIRRENIRFASIQTDDRDL